jgi:hypothetical protein
MEAKALGNNQRLSALFDERSPQGDSVRPLHIGTEDGITTNNTSTKQLNQKENGTSNGD